MTQVIEKPPAEPGAYGPDNSSDLPQLSETYTHVEPEDRLAAIQAHAENVDGPMIRFLGAVRTTESHDHPPGTDYPGSTDDGIVLAYAKLRDPKRYTYALVGRIADRALRIGVDPCKTHGRFFDRSHTSVPLRDAYPGESFDDHMDYMAGDSLRLPQRPEDEGVHLRTLNPVDTPGTRFRSDFGAHDSAVVALGKIRRGDIAGAIQTIDNGMFQTMRWGAPPNFDTFFSLDRSQTPHGSFAVEALAARYGDRSNEVWANYSPGFTRLSQFWLGDITALNAAQIPLGRGGAVGRHGVLPTLAPDGSRERVFRNYSDAIINYDTLQGVRLEGVREDVQLLDRIVHGLEGEARKQRWEAAMRHILAACESTKDFQPSSQSADGYSMETIRTTEIAPVMLQAMLTHLFRTTATSLRVRGQHAEATYYENEERQLAGVLNRRMWHDVSETEGHYTDLLIADGSQTGAFDATSCYPLLVGGIVSYDRAIKMANLFKNKLAREYGYMISAATTSQQWDGSPDNPLTGEEGDNRLWPSVNMFVVEAFLMAAIEAKANGNDPEPLLRAAEVGLGMVSGVQQLFDLDGHVTEKLNAVRPTAFVNGGEYGKTKETVQKGFGMTIGAVRQLEGRDLRMEMDNPEESWRRLTFRRMGGLLVPAP